MNRRAGLALRQPAVGTGSLCASPPRVDPQTGEVKPHPGMDFRAAQGTVIRTNTPATVVFSGDTGAASHQSYGYLTVLQTSYGQIGYGHQVNLPGLVSGMSLPPGVPFGVTGNTGMSDKAHLHVESHYPGSRFKGGNKSRGMNKTNTVEPCR